MSKEKILPSVLIVIDVLAALGYLHANDFRRVIYWIAAAVLTEQATN